MILPAPPRRSIPHPAPMATLQGLPVSPASRSAAPSSSGSAAYPRFGARSTRRTSRGKSGGCGAPPARASDDFLATAPDFCLERRNGIRARRDPRGARPDRPGRNVPRRDRRTDAPGSSERRVGPRRGGGGVRSAPRTGGHRRDARAGDRHRGRRPRDRAPPLRRREASLPTSCRAVRFSSPTSSRR